MRAYFVDDPDMADMSAVVVNNPDMADMTAYVVHHPDLADAKVFELSSAPRLPVTRGSNIGNDPESGNFARFILDHRLAALGILLAAIYLIYRIFA